MVRAFYSTNDTSHKVTFEKALMEGMAPKYGLYTISPAEVHSFTRQELAAMKGKPYADIAFKVLHPFLSDELPDKDLEALLQVAYDPKIIPTDVEQVTENTHIMWLTQGPTYSFKDYAARFFGQTLDYFLQKQQNQRIVLVATSGDTGGAIAHALHDLQNVKTFIFYPAGEVSDEQRKQMTTFPEGVYAIEVYGGFDVCQAIVKYLIEDRKYAFEIFQDAERITSANSISVGRLLPQAVYPFFAFSRLDTEEFVPSIPSGNFGDLMGTVLAKAMGLPISTIVCGVNENREFPDYLTTGEYVIKKPMHSPSVAMNVSHPSNLARLIDYYGGHMFDMTDEHGKVIRRGIIDKQPDLEAMRRDIFAFSVSDDEHYQTMARAHKEHSINGNPLYLDPHGAVAWRALEEYRSKGNEGQAVIYETAWAGKFRALIREVIGKEPEIPQGIRDQENLPEKIYHLNSDPDRSDGKVRVSSAQIEEAKALVAQLANEQ